MSRKLIFFDVDGTLLTEGKEQYIPESTTRALNELRANGHVCIINTGRPTAALDNEIKKVPVDGFVCGCGTTVMLDEVLLSHHLEDELCPKIIRELDACNLEWMLEGDEGVYYSTRPYYTKIVDIIQAFHKRSPEILNTITTEQYDTTKFVKFIFFVQDEESITKALQEEAKKDSAQDSAQNSTQIKTVQEYMESQGSDYQRFYQTFQDQLDFIDRGNGMYEVIPKGYSKATGMKFLEDYLGIAHEDTFAVGDSSNDIPMLDYAATSILMGDADEALYEHADYVTTSIYEDGIYNAFKHYGLI